MAIVTNFDTLSRLHAEARLQGAGSRAWIEFADTMMDSFPTIYKKARLVTTQLLDCESRLMEMREGLK